MTDRTIDMTVLSFLPLWPSKVRASDIADETGYTGWTVNAAIRRLSDEHRLRIMHSPSIQSGKADERDAEYCISDRNSMARARFLCEKWAREDAA